MWVRIELTVEIWKLVTRLSLTLANDSFKTTRFLVKKIATTLSRLKKTFLRFTCDRRILCLLSDACFSCNTFANRRVWDKAFALRFCLSLNYIKLVRQHSLSCLAKLHVKLFRNSVVRLWGRISFFLLDCTVLVTCKQVLKRLSCVSTRNVNTSLVLSQRFAHCGHLISTLYRLSFSQVGDLVDWKWWLVGVLPFL